jgi:predicted transcriptional regulator of viral defense system
MAVKEHETLEEKLLRHLEREGRDTLDLKLDGAWLHTLSRNPKLLIARMRDKGLLHTIQRGRYIVNVDGRSTRRPLLDALDPLAAILLKRLDHPYYLSWHSALWRHGLLDQQSSRLLVAVKEIRKRPARIGMNQVRFITVNEARFFGYEPIDEFGIKVNVATVERTIIDAFDRPRLAAPIPVVANALRSAWEENKLEPELLVDYALLFRNMTLNRRLGFFMDFYEIPGSDRLVKEIGTPWAVPLVPGADADKSLPVNRRWHVYEDPAVLTAARSLR